MSEQLSRSAEQQGELWSAAGDDWAELLAPTVSPLWGATLDAARVTRGTRLLDVGCGSGDVLAQAKHRGASVTGIDPAEELLEIARDRVPGATFHRGGMEVLPFEDDAFDAVVYVNSLMFGDDPASALREARRTLAPSGRLGVAIWAEPDRCEFRHVVQALAGTLPEPPASGGPFALSEPGTLESVLEAGGFELCEERRVPTPMTYMDRDHYVQAVLGMGPGQGVLRQIDEATVTDALLAAAEPFRVDDGAYRFENTFRVVGARPETSG